MRLFVAVAVAPGARAALAGALAPLRAAHPDLRWVRPEGWHLTVAFLGEVSTGGRLRAQLAVGRAAAGAVPAELSVDGVLGRFGDRVLWARVGDRGDALAALAGSVRTALDEHGFDVDDRAFRPHVTLARGRRGRRLPRDRRVTGTGVPARWAVTDVALVESSTGPGGSRYRTVATWPLAASPDP